MERKITRLFLLGLLMVTFLTESGACKKCGHPLCHGFGAFGGHPLLGGAFGGHPVHGGLGDHPILGGGLGGHPLLGGGLGGHPLLGGYGGHPLLGGLGGHAAIGYPVPYPVPVPVPVAAPYLSSHHEFKGIRPIDAGYFEDDYIPRRRLCRCQVQSHGAPAKKHPATRGRGYGDYC